MHPRDDWSNFARMLAQHRAGNFEQKAEIERRIAAIIRAAALGKPLSGWGDVADAIHLAYTLRLHKVSEDVRLCDVRLCPVIPDVVLDAKANYLLWHDSKGRSLPDISEHQGSVDLEYVQRKLSLAGDMAVAIRRFLDRVEEHRLQGQACPVCKTSRLRKLRKVMENYLNCEGYTMRFDPEFTVAKCHDRGTFVCTWCEAVLDDATPRYIIGWDDHSDAYDYSWAVCESCAGDGTGRVSADFRKAAIAAMMGMMRR